MKKIKCTEHNGENVCSLPLKEKDSKVIKEVISIRKKYPLFIYDDSDEMFSVDRWINHLEE